MGCLRVPSTTYRILGTVYRGYRIFFSLSASESAARKSSLNITSRAGRMVPVGRLCFSHSFSMAVLLVMRALAFCSDTLRRRFDINASASLSFIRASGVMAVLSGFIDDGSNLFIPAISCSAAIARFRQTLAALSISFSNLRSRLFSCRSC